MTCMDIFFFFFFSNILIQNYVFFGLCTILKQGQKKKKKKKNVFKVTILNLIFFVKPTCFFVVFSPPSWCYLASIFMLNI